MLYFIKINLLKLKLNHIILKLYLNIKFLHIDIIKKIL